MARTVKPAASMRARIFPVSRRSTASGLMIANVRSILRAKHLSHFRTHVGRTPDDVDARLGERVHLFRRRPLAARNDRARVAHAAAWRCCLSGDETDYRLSELAFDEIGRVLFRGAADLANHDHRI